MDDQTLCELHVEVAGNSGGMPQSKIDNYSYYCKNYYMPKKKRKPTAMTSRLREAINDSSLSFQALERETGVLRQTLMLFARGESSLRLDKADKLALYFDLELTERKARKNG